MNSFLKDANMEVNELFEDLKDGTALLTVLKLLCKDANIVSLVELYLFTITNTLPFHPPFFYANPSFPHHQSIPVCAVENKMMIRGETKKKITAYAFIDEFERFFNIFYFVETHHVFAFHAFVGYCLSCCVVLVLECLFLSCKW